MGRRSKAFWYFLLTILLLGILSRIGFAEDIVVYIGFSNSSLPHVSKYVEKGGNLLYEECQKVGVKFLWVKDQSSFFLDLPLIINKAKEEDRVWLIFSGHRGESNSVLSGDGGSIDFKTLESILKGKRIFFLGFDVCSVPIGVLKAMGEYAEFVAGSPVDEVELGWEGIYKHFSEVLKKGIFKMPVIFYKYYLDFYRSSGKFATDSGFPCQEFVLVSKSVDTAVKVCYGGDR